MKFSQYIENMFVAMTAPAAGGVQKSFQQPTMVSVKSMTKKSFKNAKKPYKLKRKKQK